jgi:hypothetical protein
MERETGKEEGFPHSLHPSLCAQLQREGCSFGELRDRPAAAATNRWGRAQLHLRPTAAAPRFGRTPLRPCPAAAAPRCGRTHLHVQPTTTAPRCSRAQLHIRPATAAPRWGRAQLHLRPAAAAPRWGRAPLRPRPASVAHERGPELSSASMSWVKGGCPAGTAVRAAVAMLSAGHLAGFFRYRFYRFLLSR